MSFPQGEQRFRQGFAQWEPLGQQELFCEMEQLLQALELKRTVFRSDHASDWLILKGVLGAEKDRLLLEIRNAIDRPGSGHLRADWQRGLLGRRLVSSPSDVAQTCALSLRDHWA